MSTKILNIEDTPYSKLFIRRILEASGYEVIEACTLAEGITLAEENHPDIILIDIFSLPNIDKPGINNPLKNNPATANIPTIAILPRTTQADDQPIAAGFDGYILKPIDIVELPKQISEFLKALN